MLDGCSRYELRWDCLESQFVFILVLKRVLIKPTQSSLVFSELTSLNTYYCKFASIIKYIVPTFFFFFSESY